MRQRILTVFFVRSAVTAILMLTTSMSPVGAADANAGGEPGTQAASDYQTYCVDCHGGAGHGDGSQVYGLRDQPPDLATLSRRNQGVFPRERVTRIIDGRTLSEEHDASEMPTWGRWFKLESADSLPSFGGDNTVVEQRIAGLINYLESIQE